MADIQPKTINDVETPCFIIDIDILKRNCQRMIERCQTFGVDLRPHMKTHKTIEGGEIMTGGTKRKIVVSTVSEAEFYADNGFDDILFAFPIVKERITKKVIALANRLEQFHILYGSDQGLEGLINTPLIDEKKWSVVLDIDCGLGRTGVLWDSDRAIQLAKKATESKNIIFQGIYVFCGNCTSPDKSKRENIQSLTTERMLDLKKRLTDAGIECKTYGCGSTASCSNPIEEMAGLTEFHPGSYIFYDYRHSSAGSCTVDDIAIRVATTVINHKPESNKLIVDAGYTAMSWDGYAPDPMVPVALGMAPIQDHPELSYPGMVNIQDHPQLKLTDLSQELGTIQPNEGKTLDYDQFPLGSRLYLIPFRRKPFLIPHVNHLPRKCCQGSRHFCE